MNIPGEEMPLTGEEMPLTGEEMPLTGEEILRAAVEKHELREFHIPKTFLTPMNEISDRTIIIGRPGCGQRLYKVSSLAMSMASPVWKAMLNPTSNFREANPNSPIELPDDDASAVYILLRIAHLQFQHVPKLISFQCLHQLAIVCDKYDCVHLVRPWLKAWLDPFVMSCMKPGQEPWLLIAWTFGCPSVFRLMTESMVWSAEVDTKGQIVNLGFVLIADRIPEGIIDGILRIRGKIIGQLLDLFYDTLENLLADKHCTLEHSHHQACNHISLALLLKALHSLNLSSQRTPAAEVTFSIVTIISKMDDSTWYTNFMASLIHYCPLRDKLNAKIRAIMSHALLAVEDHHMRHMEVQAQKSGVAILHVPSIRNFYKLR